MEDYVILLIIAMIGGFSLIGAKMFKPNQDKNKQKSRKDNAYDTLDKVNGETIERLAKELKKESGRANRLQALKEQYEGTEDEEEPAKKEITFEEITALVNQTYPKYAPMLPLKKKQILEVTKGKSLDDVLAYVKQITGDKKSSTGDPASITNKGFNPNYA